MATVSSTRVRAGPRERVVDEHAHDLLGEQRIALGRFEDAAYDARWQLVLAK